MDGGATYWGRGKSVKQVAEFSTRKQRGNPPDPGGGGATELHSFPEEGYTFHVPVPDASSLTGYVMVEQIKSVDCASRKARFVEKASTYLLNEVLAILDACLRGRSQ